MKKGFTLIELLACQPKALRRQARAAFTLIKLLACQPKALRRQARAAFTLIELLVVITILGILMAMMVPAAGMIMRRAANARARADADIVVATLLKYRMEYNRWPVSSGEFLTDANWVALMSPPPTAPRPKGNFKKIIFFEGGGGSLAEGGTHRGAFVDSWGNPYKFMVDTTGLEGIVNPDPDPEEFDGEPRAIQATAIAWSAGPDKKLESRQAEDWNDNLKSWWK